MYKVELFLKGERVWFENRLAVRENDAVTAVLQNIPWTLCFDKIKVERIV